jgi:hypothetical protein
MLSYPHTRQLLCTPELESLKSCAVGLRDSDHPMHLLLIRNLRELHERLDISHLPVLLLDTSILPLLLWGMQQVLHLRKRKRR